MAKKAALNIVVEFDEARFEFKSKSMASLFVAKAQKGVARLYKKLNSSEVEEIQSLSGAIIGVTPGDNPQEFILDEFDGKITVKNKDDDSSD